MYVNDLGMRNADKVNAYKNSIRNRRNAGVGTANVNSFAEQMQKALAARSTSAGAEQASDATAVDSCCEQCRQNGQLLARMITQNLYMQSSLGGLSSLGFLGYSSAGAGNLAAYNSMMNLLGSQIYSLS